MGVAPPGTLAHCFAIRWGASPCRRDIYPLVIIYALVTVTNNYTTKTRVGQGAKPPPSERSEPKRAGRRNAQSQRGGRRNAQRNAP